MKWILLALLLTFAASVPATEFRSGNTVTIPAGEVINDDLVVSAGELIMQGRVTGDLVVAAGDATVSGPVEGNLIVAAGNVAVSQPIGGSVYVASGDVSLDSPVGRNVVAAAGSMVVGEAARVGRDLTVAGGDVTVRSQVGRNLNGSIGNLTLASGAVIGGDVIAQAGQTEIAEGAVIQGERRITQAQGRRGPFGILGWFFGQLFFVLSLLLAGLLFVALAPRLTEETETELHRQPWISLAAGAVIFLLALPLFIFLLLTIIGIPVAFIWGALYLAALFISPIFPAIFVGHRLWRGAQENLFLALLVGLGLLLLVSFIPFFGGLVMFAAALFGLGALALAIYDRAQRRRRERHVEPVEPPQAPPEAPPQAA